jgi:hypothetical protein
MTPRSSILITALTAALVTGCGGSSAPPPPVPARLLEDPGFVATGDHEMRYGIVLASELPAQVAKAYAINRSKDRVIVNVSVLHRQAGVLPSPIEAEVEGEWRTLVGEPQPLAFRAVLEGAAVSYIAEAPVRNQEPTTFELRARPPHASTITASVTRSFDTTSQ